MYSIAMTLVLAGTTAAPANGRAWEEIYGVYGTYGGYGGFGACGYSGYSSYARYAGCGPRPGYVVFIDNGACNRPYPVFIPAPPSFLFPPCFGPAGNVIAGEDGKDEMVPEKPAKKKKNKRKSKGEDDEDDDARLQPGMTRELAQPARVELDPRCNHRVALAQAMWRRVTS